MVLLEDAIQDKKLDTRNLERNLSRGVIQAEDVQKLVKQLPDDTDAGEWVGVDSLSDSK